MKNRIFELWHYKIGPDEEAGDDGSAKDIGLYSTEDNAKAAIGRLKDKPGFRDWPGGFRIFSIPLDHDRWDEGFISSDDA